MLCNAVLENFASKFIGRMEYKQSITKFVAQHRNAIRAGEPKTRDQSVK